MNILQSSLAKFSLLLKPTDASSQVSSSSTASPTNNITTGGPKIPFSRTVQKLYADSKTFENYQQTFTFLPAKTNGAMINMIFLKFTIPSQKIFSNSVYLGLQDVFGVKYIKSVSIKIGETQIESLVTFDLLQRLTQIYANNWQLFKEKFIGNSDNPIFYTKNQPATFTKAVPSTVCTIPLPFSIFINADKFKSVLIDKNISVTVNFNKMESVFVYNNSDKVSLNLVDFKNNMVLVENISLSDPNLNFSTIPYLQPGAKAKPYYVFDPFVQISSKRVSSFENIEIPMRQADTVAFELFITVEESKKLYYGINTKQAVSNFFSSFVFSYSELPAIKTHLLNLKDGNFFGANSNAVGGFSTDFYDSRTLIVSYSPNASVSHSVRLISNDPWFSLNANLYLDLNSFRSFNYKNINIFYFTELFFSFTDTSANIFSITPTTSQNQQFAKINGGLFVYPPSQALIGFTDYTINSDITNEKTIALMAASSVNPNLVVNSYTSSEYFVINDSLDNYWDLDKNYLIEIDWNSVTFKQGTVTILDQDVIILYTKNLTTLTNHKLVSNFSMEFSALDTSGSIKTYSDQNLSFVLSSSGFFNNLLHDFNITDFLKENNISLNIQLTQHTKRYIYYLNGELNTLTSYGLIEQAIINNFSQQRSISKKRKLEIEQPDSSVQ